MWLINTSTTRLEPKPFYEPDIPPYAILSHTWGDDEVDFQEFKEDKPAKLREGWYKIKNICEKALCDGLQYAWVDTCCIDKSSSAELSESINSMFFWYRQAAKCYVFLSDFKHGSTPEDQFPRCRWFTRGWTLQELLAPRIVIFYDRVWEEIGSKIQLCHVISGITSIPKEAILNDTPLAYYSISQKMSWAASRVTTRIEDTAYCLLGIFDVYIPLLYGERHRAFFRLQEEISKNTLDMTLLAWEPTPEDFEDGFCSFIARSPASFKSSGNIRRFGRETRACSMSARGLQFNDKHPARLIPTSPDYYTDIGKIGKRPKQFIVFIAVTMIGPSLYARNGRVHLRIQVNGFDERRPYYFQPLTYPIYLATMPRHAFVSIKDSLHFQADPRLRIFDGSPRKLWNEVDSLFYYSRDSNLRVLDMRGTFGSILMQLVVLVFFRNGEPRCLIFDRKEYPEYATKLLNHTWSEHNEGWVPESPELSKLDSHTRICQGGNSITISSSIKHGVVNSISNKRIWSVSIGLSEIFELPRFGVK
ncbi:HET-domain-containing protein [Hyaloscypha bicolor E]|uniref:HET-domain-containing protein n=1 Tax=Hyaloscypha bicolor E TaxID=1095630 RepID=A0A2J6TC42_9HELO|nr:HET-domain-containing protein [Hyaloscypha bicolor E]PMD60563.1 HET-domain-containing protein [Hyaloscypha bicolor E]